MTQIEKSSFLYVPCEYLGILELGCVHQQQRASHVRGHFARTSSIPNFSAKDDIVFLWIIEKLTGWNEPKATSNNYNILKIDITDSSGKETKELDEIDS